MAKKTQLFAVYEIDDDGRNMSDEIIATIRFEYDDKDRKYIQEDYKLNKYCSMRLVSKDALAEVAKKMGWKNQYWCSYGADEITEEKLLEYKKRVKLIYTNSLFL